MDASETVPTAVASERAVLNMVSEGLEELCIGSKITSKNPNLSERRLTNLLLFVPWKYNIVISRRLFPGGHDSPSTHVPVLICQCKDLPWHPKQFSPEDWFSYSFIQSFIRSSIHSLIDSFIHSFNVFGNFEVLSRNTNLPRQKSYRQIGFREPVTGQLISQLQTFVRKVTSHMLP